MMFKLPKMKQTGGGKMMAMTEEPSEISEQLVSANLSLSLHNIRQSAQCILQSSALRTLVSANLSLSAHNILQSAQCLL